MATRSEKVLFAGSQGFDLAARLDLPEFEAPKAYALFAHCFTCSKDIYAASRIANALAARGVAVLRFDFTGLGASEGEFANTNFSSNVEDLRRAADWLAKHHKAPALLIGHSLGGAAVLSVAESIKSVKAVVTIGAPSVPEHVTHMFTEDLDQIAQVGLAHVELAGRPFTITRDFVEDLTDQTLLARVGSMKKALLVFHAPLDDTVGIDNATEIFIAAKHPKSFVSLDQADHLLTRRADAVYVADVIASWSHRYLGADAAPEPEVSKTPLEPGVVLVAETGQGSFANAVTVGRHQLRADEPVSVPGGKDTGPSPYDYLLAGLGACTSMTLRMYAERKGLALEKVAVSLKHDKVHAKDCDDCQTQTGKIDVIEREIEIIAPGLDEATRARLLEIADKCPVHKTLHGEVKVRSRLKE